MTEFAGVPAPLNQALTARGYETLTPVQEAVIAEELVGADALVSAQTGSGKTVAFGLAMAPDLLGEDDRLPRAGTPLTLVIAPTRELAMQVQRELAWLYQPAGGVLASCVGGMDARSERRALDRGAHIVVGTPGRLRDHIERGSLDLSDLRVAVLDEADEMLDLGFREDLEFILEAANDNRRTLMFSATVSKGIAAMAKTYQRDAVRIATTGAKDQHQDIDHQAILVANHDRDNAIMNLLRFHEARNAIVFCGTRMMVNHLTSRLSNRGFSVVALSGELSQSERSHALQAMRDGRARVCVATDVAARGIDLPGLELVIHADLPQNVEALTHRSGRTGRAGAKGTSALVVTHSTRKKAQRLLGWAKLTAKWVEAPTAESVRARDAERMMTDPVLTAEPDGDEAEWGKKLLAEYSAEHLAAAYVRQYLAQRSAPEEIAATDVSREAAKPVKRDEFKDSMWVSLSIGHDQKAEPRWLLPTLCRAGDLNKTDIGAIRVMGKETFVQLNAAAEDRFFKAVGADRMLEDEIKVTKLDKAPDLPARSPRDGKSFGSDGPRGGKRDFGDKPRGPKRDYGDKPRGGKRDYDDKPRGPKRDYDDKPRGPKKPYNSEGDAPREDRSERSGGEDRPPYKKKFSEKPRTKDDGGVTPYKKREAAGSRGGDKPPFSAKPKRDGGKGKPAGKPASKFKAGAGDASKSMRKPRHKNTKGKK
ncbi:MAG: DEAD/DEAH box helicase [Pseudoruegeria sp.]